MEKKILKTVLAIVLIITLAMADVIFLGYNIVMAASTTNVENVEFDTYFNEKEASIQKGNTLTVKLAVKNTGTLKDAKIKIENANFKLKEIQSQWIKSINTTENEIEFNQLIAGNEIQIDIPVIFAKNEGITQEYLSQTANIKLTGTYKNGEYSNKTIQSEKTVSMTWTEEQKIAIEQNIEKWVELNENQTLIEQKVGVLVINNVLVKEKRLEINVPEIQNTLPEKVELLVNGKNANMDQSAYSKENKKVTINIKTNENYEEYKLIYYYPTTFQKQTIKLNSKLDTLLYTGETINKEASAETEIEKTNNTISVQDKIKSDIYKGYLYTNSENDTNYSEEMQVEIATLENIDTIKINEIVDNFLDENNIKNSVNNSIHIRGISFNKNELTNILGEDFNIKIQEVDGTEITQIDKNSECDESGKLTISLEEKELARIEIILSKPTQIGTFNIYIDKYIKGETGYSKEQLKAFTKLESTKTLTSGENKIKVESVQELKDTVTSAKFSLNTTKFSSNDTNTNVQMTATLQSDSNTYDLYKNPYIEIKLPEELKQIKIHSINKVYGDEFKFIQSSFIPETKTIILQLEGEQKQFKTATEEGMQIVIDADLTFIKNTPSKEISINMLYKNENGDQEQYETQAKATLATKFGAVLYNNISGYNEENSSLETIDGQKIEATLDLEQPEKQATVNQSFINNYNADVNQVTMVGNLIGQNTKIQNITAKQENVKIYYSEKENATPEDDSWQESIENAKSYKIEQQGTLAPAQTIDISYQLTIPAGLVSGEKILEQTNVQYEYQNQELKSTSNIELTAKIAQISENQGIKTEITATSANKELKGGEEIFEGQTIKYAVQVTNNTGTDLHNFELLAEHTNAIYYVSYEKEAEITDYPENPEMMKFTRKDENAKNITRNLETLKKGETVTFKYDFVPKNKNGREITGKITMKADELPEQEIQTIRNTIKDAELEVEALDDEDENYQLSEGDVMPYYFCITNYTSKQQKDVILKITPSDTLIMSTIDNVPYKGQDLSEDVGRKMEDNEKVEFVSIDKNILTLKLPTIEAKETIEFGWPCFCKESNVEEDTDFYNEVSHTAKLYCTAELNNTTYYSNTLEREYVRKTARISGEQTANIENTEQGSGQEDTFLKVGDKIEYTAKITNIDTDLPAELTLTHAITNGVAKILNGYVETPSGKTEAKYIETAFAYTTFVLQPGETAQYKAEVEVWDNPNSEVNYEDFLTSNMSINWPLYGDTELNSISLEMDSEDTSDTGDDYGDNGENQGNPENPNGSDENQQKPNQDGNGGTIKEKYSIGGMAYIDANRDGVKGEQEKGISDMNVNLIDTQTSKNVKTSKTDSNGMYKFSNIEQGNYIITFEYDTTLYNVTQYHKEGVSDDKNSDVIRKTLNNSEVAVTDNIVIRNNDIENIDAGFIENQKFDFSIDKTISKVTVKNSAGTREINYNKTKLAKVDIHAKQIANSIVTVKYNIEVKNEGEIPGQVNDIIDYMPNDLEFTKEENIGWYIGEDGNLHNVSLEKTIIEPGETKEVTLVLTKKMTENNTGTSANIVEIASATNEASVPDFDSTPGNRKDGEDDISTAELLVSIGTGLEVYVTIGIILMILVLTTISGTIYWKKKGGEKSEKKN